LHTQYFSNFGLVDAVSQTLKPMKNGVPRKHGNINSILQHAYYLKLV